MHGGWIAARLGRLPKAAPFQPGTVVPLRGVPHRIVHRAGERGTVWTETRDSGEKILCVAGGAEHHRPPRPRFPQARSAQGSAQGLARPTPRSSASRCKRVSIRDQSSRWGSCTSAGSLSFSWRLILAPPYVLDYLAAHEVAHLVEMNHSARFWRVVGKVCRHVERAKTLARYPRQRSASLRDRGLGSSHTEARHRRERKRAIAVFQRSMCSIEKPRRTGFPLELSSGSPMASSVASRMAPYASGYRRTAGPSASHPVPPPLPAARWVAAAVPMRASAAAR